MKKTLLTILATTAAISASAATVKDLSDKEVLTIDANTTWYGTTGQSPINVPGNTRAVINIKKGKTLTVYGADASGQTFGVPAIYVPPTATLYITGEGKLVAVGGNVAFNVTPKGTVGPDGTDRRLVWTVPVRKGQTIRLTMYGGLSAFELSSVRGQFIYFGVAE